MTDQTTEVLPIPCGNLVLVKIKTVTHRGLIALPDSSQERHGDGCQIGTLVAIGKEAWKDIGDGSPQANIGDEIYFKRYAGIEFRNLENTLYRIMNDEDVWAVLPPEYTAGVKQSV